MTTIVYLVFTDTQNAICTVFLYDTIPNMKTMERITNPCFQDTPFATVMKGKHVLNEPDETDLESYHVDESSGQAMVVTGRRRLLMRGNKKILHYQCMVRAMVTEQI